MLDKQSFGKVAVLFGGWSAEREISLASGSAILKSLQENNVDVFGIDAKTPSGMVSELLKSKPDRVFIAIHGRGGEDGVTQGVLETMNIPYTGSGVFGSSLSLDKLASKQIWSANDLPTPKVVELYEGFDEEYIVETLGLPLAVKPRLEGSSLGISKVDCVEDLLPAWQKAAVYGEVLAECWIIGEEYSVAFVRDRIFPAIALKTDTEFYDYDAKYKNGHTHFICPAHLEAAKMADLQYLVWTAAEALNIKGWGRIDLVCDEKGKFWLLEANTVPGMTSHSLVPLAAQQDNVSFNQLTLQILATSNERADV